jgi:ribosomal protein S18 acetylase RimI-like enzyme
MKSADAVLKAAQYSEFSAPEFEAAIYGQHALTGVSNAPWLQHPKLKYYQSWPALVLVPSQRRVFVAHVLSRKVSTSVATRKIIGMLELQVDPSNSQKIWLLYISVDPSYQLRQIASNLALRMVQYLKYQGLELVRSTPSEEGINKGLQAHLDRVLDEHQVSWRQRVPGSMGYRHGGSSISSAIAS